MSSSPGTRPSFGSIVAGLVALVALIGLLAWLVLNGAAVVRSFFPPDPASRQGREIFDLYTIVFIIAAAIFFLVEGLIVWSVIRYRRRPGDIELPPQTHGHNLAEIVWTVVPTIIVVFLFFISWQTLNSVEATTPQPDLKVRAVAGQFQWQFDYLAADAGPTERRSSPSAAPTGQEGGLVLPAGKTTHLYLSSPDVIHAFYVPHFLFKRDVVPGIVNEFDLTTRRQRRRQTFRGQCAELCGVGHRIMIFEVHALTPRTFQTWYDGKIAEAKATPAPAAERRRRGPRRRLVAEGVEVRQDESRRRPMEPFTIHFDNRDAGTPHDVDILDGSGPKVFERQGLPRGRRSATTLSSRWPPARTSSSARSIRR